MSRSVLVLRLLIWCTGGCAAWAVLPRSLELSSIVLLALAIVPAVLPAIVPGRWVPLAFGVLLVLCWIGRTAVLAEGVDPIALLLLAIAWYAQHTLCALAVSIPLDAIVTPAVFLRWLVRCVPAFVAAVAGAALTALLTPTETFGVIMPVRWRDAAPLGLILLGLLVVPAVAALPVRALRRTERSR